MFIFGIQINNQIKKKKIILALSVTVIGFTSCKKTSTTPNNSTSTNSNKLSDEYLILNDGLKTDTFNNVFFNLKESSTLGKYVHYSFENNQTKNVTLDSIVKSDLKLPEITITLPHDLSQLSVGVKSLLNTIYEASYFDNSKMYTLDIDETGSLCLHNYDFFRVRKNDGSPTYPNNTSNKNYS